jgi:hypothetical protein
LSFEFTTSECLEDVRTCIGRNCALGFVAFNNSFEEPIRVELATTVESIQLIDELLSGPGSADRWSDICAFPTPGRAR